MPIPADYVDVAERIRAFREQYPEGSLQAWEPPKVMTVGDRTFIVYVAAAYRTPEDVRPGIGYAWEPVPGPTPFTRDSELMNAETSAWGRAIVALGFATKKIASAQEVENRQTPAAAPERPAQAAAEASVTPGQIAELAQLLSVLAKNGPASPDPTWTWADEARRYTKANFEKTSSKDLTKAEAHQLREYLEERINALAAEEGVPFS